MKSPRHRILDPDFEPDISENGQYLLRLRYLQKQLDGRWERPVEMFRRVAWNLADAERAFRPVTVAELARVADCFFRVMTDRKFLPNAPTLLGAGAPLQQLCACFVLPIGDSIDQVFNSVRMGALVHSHGGGTGYSFGNLRSKGTSISTGGSSTGVVSFMRIFDLETEIIKQGGTGWGANMGVLPCDHPDIEDFIAAKSDGKALRNFNLSVGVTDEFMRRLDDDGDIALVDPHSGVTVRQVSACKLFEDICAQAWKTGDPGLLFIDRINQANPTPRLGRIEATNPCGEAPLLSFESCCLGGINVARFLDTHGRIDWDDLRSTAKLAVRMMDNVVESCRYPLAEIKDATRATRKLGIGVMGFADLLVDMGIPYDSEDSVTLAGRLMQTIQESTHAASARLAEERGNFAAFGGSCWDDRNQPMRNATTTSNAPNSTISVVAGCSAGIEPLYALGYTKHLSNGDQLIELHPALVRAARFQGFDHPSLLAEVRRTGRIGHLDEIPAAVRRAYVIAHEVSPEWHIRVQAAFQRYTDLGTSKTINLPREAPPSEIQQAYRLAYRLGCKGITCFRDGCLEQQFLAVSSDETGQATAEAKTCSLDC